jgi:hypothetical protein
MKMAAKSLISLKFVAFAATAALLVGCGGSGRYQSAPSGGRDRDAAPSDSVSSGGGGGNSLFGSKKDGEAVAVNAFLWRASLDTMAFMPLASADPFGGVILTDWYAPPEAPDERFKVNVYILSRVLRADGLKITVFRQMRDTSGQWHDAVVGPEVSTEFENAVLTRARDLRLRAVPESN